MRVRVQTEEIEVGAEIARVQAAAADVGAVASFLGSVRAPPGDDTYRLTLEHYPGMTEVALEAIVVEAQSRFEMLECSIIHRVGVLMPGAQIVLVAVGSRHRAESFNACEFIMDMLKTKAPFWKKESSQGGEHWVEAREGDDHAAARWSGRKP